MLLAGLLFMAEPYYTWAQDQNDHPCRISLDPEVSLFELDRMNPGDSYSETVVVTKTGEASANLYLTWDWVSGDPELGELGSLFEQLILVISFEGEELYRGPMVGGPIAGDPSSIEDALFVIFMEQGDEIALDITVILPGPETGNEFQGSTLETELVFYTICTEEPTPPPQPPPQPPPEEPDDPDDPVDQPDVPEETDEEPETPAVVPDPDPDPVPEEEVEEPEDPEVEPEPEEDDEVIVVPETPQVDPPLPRTDGTSLGLIIGGILLLIAGLSLRKSNEDLARH